MWGTASAQRVPLFLIYTKAIYRPVAVVYNYRMVIPKVIIVPGTRGRQHIVGLALHVLVISRKAPRKHIDSGILSMVYVCFGVGHQVCGR